MINISFSKKAQSNKFRFITKLHNMVLGLVTGMFSSKQLMKNLVLVHRMESSHHIRHGMCANQ